MALNNLWPSGGDFNFDGMGERMTAATMRQAFDDAEIISIWPVPDMTLTNNGRRPPVPMPCEVFGPAWSIILDVAAVTSTAPDYAAMGYLAAAASLIGGSSLRGAFDCGSKRFHGCLPKC